MLFAALPRPRWEPSLRKVALSGESAPGAGRTFNRNFGPPVINNLSKTAFSGNLNCCDIPGGVWSTGAGSLNAVGLIGSPAQPGGSQKYLSFYSVQLDDLGRTTITAQITDAPAEFQGVFTGLDSSNVNRIAASGQPIAGSNPSRTFFDVGGVAVGSNGYMVAAVVSQGSSITSLLWASDGNSAGHKLLQNGDPVPFAGSNIVFGNLVHNTFYRPQVNSHGQLGLRTSFVNSQTNEINYDYHLMLIDTDNHLESVLDSGDPAPGFAAGVKFGAISDPAMNNLGDFAYGAVIGPFGVGSRAGVWISKHGLAPQLIALEKTQPPGMPTFTFAKTYFSDTGDNFVRISDKQDVVFRAEIDGPGLHDAESVWIGSSASNVHPLVVEGSSVPERSGVVFRSMTSTSGDLINELTMNKNSQVAFLASVSGIGPDLRRGLFATDTSGSLHPIIVYGDMIEVSPGDFRQVDDINFDGGRFNPGSGLNDLGEVAFAVRFTDGSGGVFVSTAVAIPEPTATVAFGLCIALALLSPLRRRNHALLSKHGARIRDAALFS